MTLEAILGRCAYLRGVSNLQHRILHEFDWFVGAIIWHEWDKYPDREDYQVLKKFDERHEWMNETDALLKWAELFEEYYQEQAKEWRKFQDEEMKELIEMMRNANKR